MAKALPSRKEAVYTIIAEARAERVRKRAYAKTDVALMVLGLDNEERVEILQQLELVGSDGKPRD